MKKHKEISDHFVRLGEMWRPYSDFKTIKARSLSDLNLVSKVVHEQYLIVFEEHDNLGLHSISFSSRRERDSQFSKVVKSLSSRLI